MIGPSDGHYRSTPQSPAQIRTARRRSRIDSDHHHEIQNARPFRDEIDTPVIRLTRELHDHRPA